MCSVAEESSLEPGVKGVRSAHALLEQALRLLDNYIRKPTKMQRRGAHDRSTRRSHVAAVLSALRGPDWPDIRLDGRTTG